MCISCNFLSIRIRRFDSSNFQTKKDKKETAFFIGEVALSEIVKKVPPPLYIYDVGTIRAQYKTLEKALSSNGIHIYYSVKANTSLAVIHTLYNMGSGLEVASLGELLAAQKVGAHFKNVSFAGPVKTDEEITFAIKQGIGTINVESFLEFERINRIASKLGKRQKVGIRVNPEKEVEGAGGLMGGGPRKFGFDVELLTPSFIKKIRALPHIKLVGVHVFAATQMLNTKAFLANIENVCKIAEMLNRQFALEYVDFGGGLGIPYSQNESHLPLQEISQKIGKTLKKYPFLRRGIKLYVEPGRFLVGPSGIYVARVDNIKKSRGKEMILVDGGIHHMLRPALGFGYHPTYNLSRLGEKVTHKADIGGSLCTSLDFIAKDVEVAKTHPGDLIGVFNGGAYGWSEAMTYFLSHATPAEVMVNNKTFSVIRSIIHPKDFLKNQTIPKNSVF